MEHGAPEGRLHVAVLDKGNGPEFNQHHDDGDGGGQGKIGDEVGQSVAEPAKGGHDAGGKAALEGGAAAGELAVVGGGFGEAHGDAGADGGGQAHKKGLVGVARRKGGGKHWSKGRDRAIHEPGEPGLHIGQNELAVRFGGFAFAAIGTQNRDVDAVSGIGMLALLRGQIAQEAANGGVGRLLGGFAVEAIGALLHFPDLLAHGVERQRFHQPERLAGDETLYMFAADGDEALAEALHVKIEQPAAVLVFFGGHGFEKAGGTGIGAGETGRKLAVDAAIFFFRRYRERQDLAFGEA